MSEVINQILNKKYVDLRIGDHLRIVGLDPEKHKNNWIRSGSEIVIVKFHEFLNNGFNSETIIKDTIMRCGCYKKCDSCCNKGYYFNIENVKTGDIETSCDIVFETMSGGKLV